MVYSQNLGFQEMIQFTMTASDDQQKKMEIVVEREDWEAYKNLVKEVLGITLK